MRKSTVLDCFIDLKALFGDITCNTMLLFFYREQRVTALGIGILSGCAVLITSVLKVNSQRQKKQNETKINVTV